MLTYEDCVEMCDLSEEEVAAIAEHEHLPEIVAAEYGNYLIHSATGVPMIRKIILDDIDSAREHHDDRRVECLESVLKHFVATHPSRLTAPGV